MDFTILPHKGLGPFRFGMSVAEVRSLAPEYGPFSEAPRAEGTGSFTEEELAMYREMMTPEQLAQFIEANQSYDEMMAETREMTIAPATLHFTFQNEALSEIRIGPRARDLSFGGEPFFGAVPRGFLAALEEANGAPPMVRGPDCAFVNLRVYVWAAFEELESGALRFPPDGTEAVQDKSVILADRPRNPDEDFSGYRAVSFRP